MHSLQRWSSGSSIIKLINDMDNFTYGSSRNSYTRQCDNKNDDNTDEDISIVTARRDTVRNGTKNRVLHPGTRNSKF